LHSQFCGSQARAVTVAVYSSRLFKNINHAATREANVAKAAELLEKLYVMLCYSCRYTLFSAYDSFQSVGVSQEDFFRAVLRHKRRHENPRDFVQNSIELALKHELNRYTLSDDLLEAIVAFLDTPDLKEIAIATCDEMWSRASIEDASPRSASKSYEDRSIEYQRSEFLQNLARLGFLCHMALCEYDEAVEYFHKHYVQEEPEIALYVLLNMIDGYQHWDLGSLGENLRAGDPFQNPPSFGVKDSVSRDPGTRAGISLTGRRSANQKSAARMNTSLWNSMARSISPIQRPTAANAGKTGCCSRTAISFCDFLQMMSARIWMAFWIPYCSLWQGASGRGPTSCVQQDNESNLYRRRSCGPFGLRPVI